MTNMKNRFKGKQFILLVVLMLALTALVGCGSSAKTDAELEKEGWVKNPTEQGYVLESEIDNDSEEAPAAAELPAPLIDEGAESIYAADNSSINVDNLDEYMNREDVVYIDIRDYEDYAGKHFKNFEVIPYFGYIFNAEANTNEEMIQLYGGTPAEPVAVYEQSDSLLNAIFPKDQNLFIMCEKGGRVTQLMQILDAKGYDMSKVYNIGGMGQYVDKKYADHITDTYEFQLDATYNFEGLTRN